MLFLIFLLAFSQSNYVIYEYTGTEWIERFILERNGGAELITGETKIVIQPGKVVMETPVLLAKSMQIGREGNATLYVAGRGVAHAYYTFSSRKYKKEIEDFYPDIEEILSLHPYLYYFIPAKKEKIGLIAQEVKEIFPELVSENKGYFYVDYTGLLPLLLEAIKHQQEIIEENERLLEKLEKRCVGE